MDVNSRVQILPLDAKTTSKHPVLASKAYLRRLANSLIRPRKERKRLRRNKREDPNGFRLATSKFQKLTVDLSSIEKELSQKYDGQKPQGKYSPPSVWKNSKIKFDFKLKNWDYNAGEIFIQKFRIDKYNLPNYYLRKES